MKNNSIWFKWTKRMILSFVFGILLIGAPDFGTTLVQAAEVSADDLMYERKYSIKSEKNGLFIAGANGAMADSNTGEEVLVLRYGDEGSDLLDNVPAALYLDATGRYLAMDTTARAGDYPWLNGSLTRDGAEQFVLKKAPGWSSSNLVYYIYHARSGQYLAVDDNNRLYAYGKTAPDEAFVFTKTGYSNVGLLTTLDGYQQLTEAQKKRVLDVYGGVGARSLFRYGGWDTNDTLESALRGTVNSIYENRDNTSAEEEAAAMLNGMGFNMYDNQTNWYTVPELPGTYGLKTVISEGVEGTYDFWRGTMLEGKFYTFSIIDDYGTHTMDVYIQNNDIAKACANNLLEAIKRVPYPVRKSIRTLKVREDQANSYNCGQSDFYMRLAWVPDVNSVAQYIMHEFGHSMDFTYGMSDSGRWQTAIDADYLKVSGYGSSNSYEDFAEFNRMYFQMYGNYNAMYALRQLYPNRYRLCTGAHASAQFPDIYDKLLYSPEAEEKELYDGVLADFNFDDTVDGLRSGTAVARPIGNVVLDDNGYSGKALRLDGNGSNYLNVVARDYSNLLNGYDEFTISYYSKSEKNAGSWPVFLAPNAKAQNYGQERYIGILDNTTSVQAERYNNYGQRSESLRAEKLSNNAWRHVVLVVENNQTTLYVDGQKITTVASVAAVEDILGKESVFQIGKGNWGNGEYYQGLIDEFKVYGRALTQAEIQAEGNVDIVAQISFDNANDGFKGAGAVAKANGNYTLSDESTSGKALYLDGSGFVNITKADGTPLMTGYDEMTLSYYSKVESAGSNWSFYLAQDGAAPTVNYENYIGVLDRNTGITVERFKNNGARPTSVNASYGEKNGWKHVVVVVENGMTTLYVDGVQQAYVRSEYSLSDIIGNNSVLQMGKANWGNGEYFRGYIDEVTIWNGALSQVEIQDYIENGPSDVLMNIQVTAPTKTSYYVGDAFDKTGLVVTAVYGSGTKDVTAEAQVSGFDSATAGTKKITVSFGGKIASFDVVVNEKPVVPDTLAMFTFDNETNGFTNGYAVAAGAHTLVDHDGGKALYLDGNGQYLEVKKADGSSLLTDAEEITITFQAKPDSSNTNWLFYAAPNADTQQYPNEHYLGLLDKQGNVTAERFNNNGSRPASASTDVSTTDWYTLTIVHTKNETILYVNGEETARQSSEYALTEILGDNSVFYIGRANWVGGEYYKGLIDNYAVYGRALSASEVKDAYENANSSVTRPADDKLAMFTFNNDTEGFTNGYAVASGNYSLQDHDGGKALYLDGTKQYLDVVKADGSSLLTGEKELTISFQAKPENVTTNWTFYAAPNADMQQYPYEHYLGILDKAGYIMVERYDNNGSRPQNPEMELQRDGWYFMTVVYSADETILYVDGNEIARVASDYALADILGENSVLYIGRGNWNDGEYYKGLIDNYTIYGRALTAAEVKAEAEKYVEEVPNKVDKSALVTAINNAVSLNDESKYTASTWASYKTALDNAKAVNSNVNATQEAVNSAVTTLTRAQNALKTRANKDALKAEVNAAVTDGNKYTEASWSAYQTALNSAKEVLANDDATQTTVDNALTKLQSAKQNLKEAGTEPTPTPTPGPDPIKLPYVDVSEGNWFYESVYYTYVEGLMTGMDETHFGPYGQLSRAQFALILYRIEGEPSVVTHKSFGDITGDEWYGKAVLWAAEAGVVSGYVDGNFGPADNITREQMAVMMYRYANYLGKDTTNKASYDAFSDAASVSTFAKDAMQWAVAEQIITGKESGTKLDPQGNTARCEAAAIIQRFME